MCDSSLQTSACLQKRKNQHYLYEQIGRIYGFKQVVFTPPEYDMQVVNTRLAEFGHKH